MSYRSVVGIGSSSQDFAGVLLIIFKTKSSVTGSKVCKGSPVKEETVGFGGEKLFLMVRIFLESIQKRQSGDHQSQKLKEEAKKFFCQAWS